MKTVRAANGDPEFSPFRLAKARFFKDRLAAAGFLFIVFLFAVAVLAPLIANGKPLLTNLGGPLRSPALRDFFAPDCQEALVERLFNFLLPAIPAAWIFLILSRTWRPGIRFAGLISLLVLIALPFILMKSVSDHTDWHEWKGREPDSLCVFTICPVGPYKTKSSCCQNVSSTTSP